MEDYEKYLNEMSLNELLEIKQSIDREKYPDKYSCLLKAIQREEDKIKDKAEPKTKYWSPESFTDQVKSELKNIQNPQKSLGKNLGILVLTIFLFISFGFFENSVTNILVIISVLFIHEMGHLIGMKMFGYKDVQMFFIPMLGAAVSGREKNPSSIKKSIISLLGPVPGILIGIGFAVAYFKTKNDLFAVLSSSFLFINGFNLLPFHPLDGGRFFDNLLFSRHPKIEIVFKIVTTFALVGMAFLLKMPLLGFFAIFIFISLRATYISAKIAHRLKKDQNSIEDVETIMPDDQIELVLKELKDAFSRHSDNAKVLANHIHNIWQRVCNKPASILATILMIVLVYCPMMAIGVTAPFVFEAGKAIAETKTEIVEKQNADGTYIKSEIKTLNAKKLSEVPLDENGYYHGLQKSWYHGSEYEKSVGTWKNGYWHGEWRFYDEKGLLQSIREYDMGIPVKYSEYKKGQLELIPKTDWPFHIKPMNPLKPMGSKKFSK